MNCSLTGCYWMGLLSVVLIGFGIWWLAPKSRQRHKAIGFVGLGLGATGLVLSLNVPGTPLVEAVLFWLVGLSTLLFGILCITTKKPVYSALWFAMATLSTAVLFLLQSAPFLAAATVIVYAGAIVVTFVFVIMLAQQSGATAYDQRARQPALAVISGVAMFGAIIAALNHSRTAIEVVDVPGSAVVAEADAVAPLPVVVDSDEQADAAPTIVKLEANHPLDATQANPMSHPRPGEHLGTLHGMGRSLFGDYLYAVGLTSVLLLLASVGAIAIAPKRGQEHFNNA